MSVGVFELLAGSSTPLLASGDVVCFVDVSDTTQAAQGSLVKGTMTAFFAAIPVPIVVTSASASALAVGLTGATNSAFKVDASTASQVAGLKVTGAATGGVVAVVVTDSGADASLTVNAKGAGTIGIGSVSTGRVTITPVTTITGALTLGSTLTGGATSDIAINTNKFTVAASSGNTLVAGTLAVTGVATFTAQPILSSLTASQAVFTDGSKGLVSNAITGSGNVVMSASPTLTGTITAATANFSGALGVTGAVTTLSYTDSAGTLFKSTHATHQSLEFYVNTSTRFGLIGTGDSLLGDGTTDFALWAAVGKSVKIAANGALVGTFSSTGLAMNTLALSGVTTLGATSTISSTSETVPFQAGTTIQIGGTGFSGTRSGMYGPTTTTLNLVVNAVNSLQLDATATAGDTRLLVYDVSGGGLQRVTRGASDSGGAGFRLLRIPN